MLAAVAASDCGGPTGPDRVGRFPDVVGTWVGPRTVDVRENDGTTSSNACDEEWTIRSQSDADFAGIFRTGGGATKPCQEQSGFISGTITSSGTLTSFSINVTEGQAPCVGLSRTPISGGFTGATFRMQFGEEIACPADTGLRLVVRTMTLSLSRR